MTSIPVDIGSINGIDPEQVLGVVAEIESNVSPDTIDWSVLDDERVVDIINMAAGKIGTQYGSITSQQDQYQEAVIIVASHAQHVRGQLQDPLMGERFVFQWLYSKLREGVRTDAARANRTTVLGAATE